MLTCLYLFGFRILQINFDRFGQYLATTLSVCVNDDKNMTSDVGKLDDSSPAALVASRNEGLTLLFKLLLVHDKGVINLTCEIHG